MTEATAIRAALAPRQQPASARPEAADRGFARVLEEAHRDPVEDRAPPPGPEAGPVVERGPEEQPAEDPASSAAEDSTSAASRSAAATTEEASPAPAADEANAQAAVQARLLAELVAALRGVAGPMAAAAPAADGQSPIDAGPNGPVAGDLRALSEHRTQGQAVAFGQARSAPPTADPAGARVPGLPVELLLPTADGSKPSDSRSLLRFHELVDPQLAVVQNPQQVLERLREVTGPQTGAPVLDPMAAVALPQVVRGLVTVAREGAAEMRVQLDPPQLGQIELRVKTADGVVRGEVLVQHAQVKNLLDSQVDRLRTSLADQGLSLQHLDVGVARDGRFGWQDPSAGRPATGGPTWRPAPAADPGAPASVAPPSIGRHEVDYVV